eukprot:542040-Ditylum_brightwellii.AAC.1
MAHEFTKANAAQSTAVAPKRKRRKKEKGKPSRPLSAYNLFFQDEREKILKSMSVTSKQEDNKDVTQESEKKTNER